jgi:anthranilate phosphoribosyltransferase
MEGTIMIETAIMDIVDKKDLSYDEAYQVMNEIMEGKSTQTQNAAFLAALSTKSTKSETIDEIAGCAAAMRDHALTVNHDMDVLDIVGTGGDRSHSFNISTTAAFVIAADDVKVAKHGNRAASSSCGTADCLEALGARISVQPDDAVQLLKNVGFCFLFAQTYHTSMRYVGAIRKELGIRTVFNILGPLTNPAHPTMQILGVYDESLVEPLAKVLSNLGVKRGMVVFGKDNLDEISPSAETTVCELKDGFYRTQTISPEQFGLARGNKQDIVGGDPSHNAQITRSILSGEAGTKRTAVLMNAGAGLYVAGKAPTMADGVKRAAALIDSGAALQKLDEFIKASSAIQKDNNACAKKSAKCQA